MAFTADTRLCDQAHDELWALVLAEVACVSSLMAAGVEVWTDLGDLQAGDRCLGAA